MLGMAVNVFSTTSAITLGGREGEGGGERGRRDVREKHFSMGTSASV